MEIQKKSQTEMVLEMKYLSQISSSVESLTNKTDHGEEERVTGIGGIVRD